MRMCKFSTWILVFAGTFSVQNLMASPAQSVTSSVESGSGRPQDQRPKSAQLTVATFNIKWYGLGGNMNGTSADEKRDPHLKEFIAKELGTADAIVFEEIVDLARLEKNVLPTKYKCQSYENSNAKHQKVAICVNKKYKLLLSEGEPDYIWEDVMIGRHRPAVVGTVSTSTGKPLLQIIGVHLKAMPNFSSVREEQAKLIASHLVAQSKRIPTVITGDFNTFDNDEDLIQAALDEVGDDFAQINYPEEYTFRSGDMLSKFDRFWVSGAVEPVSVPKVWTACNKDIEATAPEPAANGNPYENISYYNEHISDHCPVIVKLQVPAN